METKTLQCGPITLRPIEQRDQEILLALMNDPDIEQSLVGYGFPISFDDQQSWYEHVHPCENAIRFMMEVDGDTIGTIFLADIDWDNKVGKLGCKTLRKYQGKGYNNYALCCIMEYLFLVVGIERAILRHLDTQPTSRHIAEKLGFQYEGTARAAVYKNAQRIGLVYWSCGLNEYMRMKETVANDVLCR